MWMLSCALFPKASWGLRGCAIILTSPNRISSWMGGFITFTEGMAENSQLPNFNDLGTNLHNTITLTISFFLLESFFSFLCHHFLGLSLSVLPFLTQQLLSKWYFLTMTKCVDVSIIGGLCGPSVCLCRNGAQVASGFTRAGNGGDNCILPCNNTSKWILCKYFLSSWKYTFL